MSQLRVDRTRRAAAGVLPRRRGQGANRHRGERLRRESQDVPEDGNQALEKDVKPIVRETLKTTLYGWLSMTTIQLDVQFSSKTDQTSS